MKTAILDYRDFILSRHPELAGAYDRYDKAVASGECEPCEMLKLSVKVVDKLLILSKVEIKQYPARLQAVWRTKR